jgi:tetratricopeptide (TPR) repeat protein
MKRIHYTILIFTVALFTFSYNIKSQTSDESEKLKSAAEFFNNKQYEKAIDIYKEILNDNPGDRLAWYQLGAAYYTIGQYDSAIAAYKHIAKYGNPTVLYNLACAYSKANKKDEALNALREAVDKGFSQYSLMKKDPDLKNIRNDSRFNDILVSIKSCENTPETKQLNFWVGEWDVYNPQEQKVGDSKIEKLFTGCVILENWKSLTGNEGKSFNHYDLNDKKWHQYWIDQNANTITYEGNYDSTKKALVYYSYDHAKDEKPYMNRLTFFDLGPDTVRQFSQKSTDEGKTWTTDYDFTYRRKSAEK